MFLSISDQIYYLYKCYTNIFLLKTTFYHITLLIIFLLSTHVLLIFFSK